jgi:probable HAF family extracellular repeat protein
MLTAGLTEFTPSSFADENDNKFVCTDINKNFEGNCEARYIGLAGKVCCRIGAKTPHSSTFAYLYFDGAMHKLKPGAGAKQDDARAMNDQGDVVGAQASGEDPSVEIVPCAWPKDTAAAKLDSLGGFVSIAYSINNSDQIVGSCGKKDSRDERAVLWQGGKMEDLGTLGGPNSAADCINDRGDIAGGASLVPDANGVRAAHACLWQAGKANDLGTLGGINSSAHWVNSSDTVVGVSDTPSGNRHAFIYEAGTGMHDLGAFSGGASDAFSINASGEIVGSSSIVDGSDHACLWKNGTIYDLNDLVTVTPPGWILTSAISINNAGQIACEGTNDKWQHTFVLTPM